MSKSVKCCFKNNQKHGFQKYTKYKVKGVKYPKDSLKEFEKAIWNDK